MCKTTTTVANERVEANMDLAERLARKFARRDPGQYEDLLQEAYLALVKAARSPHYDPARGDFRGWAWRCCVNRLRSVTGRCRSVKAQSLTADDGAMVEVADRGAEEVQLDPRDVEKVKQTLGTLDSKARRALELAYGLHGKGGMGPDAVRAEMGLNSRQAADRVAKRATGKLVRSLYPTADATREQDREENVRLSLLRLGLLAGLLATARRRRVA